MKIFLPAFAGFTATRRHDIHRSCRRTQNILCKETRYDGDSIGEGDGRIQYNGDGDDNSISRRSLLHSVGLSVAGALSSGPASALLRYAVSTDTHQNYVNAANAMGLVQFPCKPGSLANTYHMMRAGESGLEAEGILSTNPLFMTNRDDALTPIGMAQVEEVCNKLLSLDINPSVVKYSLASKCLDTVNIIANTMMIGRNRIVPEFTFMDGRGAGFFDGKPLESAEPALWAMDNQEGGNEGRDGAPPPTDDGTGNETLQDQVIRLRQLISILETQYSGDEILLVFPDGTSPALLSCLIAGISLKDVHALNYEPGEVRISVDMPSTKSLLKEKISSPQYKEVLAKGKTELVALRKEYEQHEKEHGAWFQSSEPLVDSSAATNFVEMKKLGNSQKSFRSAFNNDVDGRSADNAVSLGAFAMMSGMAMWRGDIDDVDESEQQVDTQINPKTALAYANPNGVSVDSTERQDVMPVSLPDVSLSVPLLVAPISTTSYTNDVNDSTTSHNVVPDDVPVLSNEDRILAAETAMDEYLSQDDGADAWLSSMADMIDEE